MNATAHNLTFLPAAGVAGSCSKTTLLTAADFLRRRPEPQMLQPRVGGVFSARLVTSLC